VVIHATPENQSLPGVTIQTAKTWDARKHGKKPIQTAVAPRQNWEKLPLDLGDPDFRQVAIVFLGWSLEHL
jgi:hypothetical protein